VEVVNRKEMLMKVLCKKCGKPTILACGDIQAFEPDDEPYEADERVEGLETIYTDVSVCIQWCKYCNEITEVWIEDPRL